MAELSRCRDAPDIAGCEDYAQELRDIDAFHVLLRNFTGAGGGVQRPQLLSVLTVLHNLVTSTVPLEFVRGRKRQYRCARAVQRAMHDAFFPDMPLPVPDDFPAEGVPGLGSHRLVRCPPGATLARALRLRAENQLSAMAP